MKTLTALLLLFLLTPDHSAFETTIGKAKSAIQENNMELALSYSKEAEQYVVTKEDLGRVYWQRGRIYDWMNDPLNANHFYYSSARIYEILGNDDYCSQLYENAGTVLLNNFVSSSAVDMYKMALNHAIKIDNSERISRLQYQLGLAYFANGNSKDALKAYLEAYRTIRATRSIESPLYTRIYNSLGRVYEIVAANESSDNYYDSAIYNYQQALEWALDDVDRYHANNNIGNVHLKRGEVKEATQFFNRALQLGKGVGSGALIIPTLNNVGIIYQQRGESARADSAFTAAILLNIREENKDIKGDLSHSVQLFDPRELYISYEHLDQTSIDAAFSNKIKDVIIRQQQLEHLTTQQLLTYHDDKMKEERVTQEYHRLIQDWAIKIGLSVFIIIGFIFFLIHLKKKRVAAKEIITVIKE